LQRRKFVRRLQMAASTVHVCSGFGGDSDRSNFVLVFHGRLRIRECVSWGSRTARRVLLYRRLRVDVKHLDCVFRDHRVVRCVRPWSRVCWGHCTASGVFLLSRLRFRRKRDSIMFGKWRHMHRMWSWLRVRWRQRAARGLLVCARSGFNINNIKFVHWHYGHLLNRRLRLRKRVYGGAAQPVVCSCAPGYVSYDCICICICIYDNPATSCTGTAGSCVACRAGYACSGGGAQMVACVCAPGTASTATRLVSCANTSASCVPCGAGSACTGVNAQPTPCACASGYSSPAVTASVCVGRALSCTLCQAGYFCGGSGAQAMLCNATNVLGACADQFVVKRWRVWGARKSDQNKSNVSSTCVLLFSSLCPVLMCFLLHSKLAAKYKYKYKYKIYL
jgi:hypothetical protein